MSSIIVLNRGLLWAESQADSKQQPPKVKGIGPKEPAESRPKPGGKAVTESAAHAHEARHSTGQGQLRKSSRASKNQMKMLEQASE